MGMGAHEGFPYRWGGWLAGISPPSPLPRWGEGIIESFTINAVRLTLGLSRLNFWTETGITGWGVGARVSEARLASRGVAIWNCFWTSSPDSPQICESSILSYQTFLLYCSE